MFEKIIEKLKDAEQVGIFTHVNPDGDALGSSYSLKPALESLGKKAEVFFCGNVEPKLLSLIKKGEDSGLEPEDCDMLISLDSADLNRLGQWSDLFANHPNTAAIDHHITHVPYAKETVMLDISSTCEVIYGMYKEMGMKLSKDIATNLYIGLSTDTGNFKYSSVTGDTHRAAAELIECDVDFADIAKKLYDTVSREYLGLEMRAIGKLEYYGGGRIAVLYLSDSDFEECNIDEATASSIVTLPGSIEGVETGVYIRQRGETECKVSLRSVSKVDVSEIACLFGGGGHIRAAGYSVDTSQREENIKKLISEIEKRLN